MLKYKNMDLHQNKEKDLKVILTIAMNYLDRYPETSVKDLYTIIYDNRIWQQSFDDSHFEVISDFNKLLSAKIPNLLKNLPVIPSGFFYNSNIVSVDIPKNIESIRYMAFYGCYDLKEINYAGTEKDWKKLSEESDDKSIYTWNLIDENQVMLNGDATTLKNQVIINCIDKKNIYNIKKEI